jgi:hypothetical protein
MWARRIRPAKRSHGRRVYIRQEPLDDRLTPAAMTWTGAGDGTAAITSGNSIVFEGVLPRRGRCDRNTFTSSRSPPLRVS